jgi:hypothetical protein
MVGLATMMLAPSDSSWPPILFWSGLALSLAAGCVYLVSVRARSRGSQPQPQVEGPSGNG